MGEISTGSGIVGVTIAEAPGGAAGDDSRPVLFLHGVGSDRSVWAPQLNGLAGRRLIAADMPGYGDSEAAGDTGHDGFAARMLALLDALHIETAHICGLSLGGVIALAMAHLEPARIASLTLADSFAVHPDGRAIRDRSAAAAQELGLRGLAEARVDHLLGSSPPDGLRAATIDTMARIAPDAYRIALDAVWLADQRSRLGAITAPTIVLCGDEDVVTPPALSRALADGLPDARLALIEGAGHLSNAERPEIFNALLSDFLDSLA